MEESRVRARRARSWETYDLKAPAPVLLIEQAR
jgi:hypothetical protein